MDKVEGDYSKPSRITGNKEQSSLVLEGYRYIGYWWVVNHNYYHSDSFWSS